MSNCLCRSGLDSEVCCFPRDYPIVDENSGWTDLSVQVYGVGNSGRIVPVPRSFATTLTLNQPHHVDECVARALRPWNDAVWRKTELLTQEAKVRALSSVGSLEAKLSHGLTATRYHRRQFLRRFRAVDARHRQARVEGTGRVELVLEDLPLQCELEAFLTRTSGSLDALAQLLGLIVTGKQRTFGAFVQILSKSGKPTTVLKKELSATFAKHSKWIDEGKEYRNSIVHEAAFDHFKAPKASNVGISSAYVAEDDASKFVINVWTRLLQMVEEVCASMYKHYPDWKFPMS